MAQPATVAVYNTLLKETWTSDRMEQQLYDDTPLLNEIERTTKYKVGANAIVPLHTGRNGGYSVKPDAGGTLNAAGAQKSNEATYNYANHYQQIGIEAAVIEKTSDKAVSVAEVVDNEVTGSLSDLRRQITRQLFMSGDSLIAQCGTTTASTTVVLDSVSGKWAITRGFLVVDQYIDIGTTANETSIAAGVQITAVDEVNYTITISGAAVTTSSANYVSIKDARAGATAYEMNGLGNLVKASGTVGGLSTATEASWASPMVDATAQDVSLSLLYTGNRKVAQKTGKQPTYLLTSLLQQQYIYEQAQAQVRYSADNISVGDTKKISVAGMDINAHQDCPDANFYFLTKESFLMVESRKPHWQNEITGGDTLTWSQGTTGFVGMLAYHANIGLRRRNNQAAYTGLNS